MPADWLAGVTWEAIGGAIATLEAQLPLEA